jgi:hypothetical protein
MATSGAGGGDRAATGGDGGDRAATGAVVRVSACPMKPVFLESAGDPPMSWQVWSVMFADHMVAYDLSGMPEMRKVAILRTSLGAEGYKICMSLCPEPDLNMRKVLARLEARFAPKVSKIYARSVFHRRSQFHDETCVQFVSQLRAFLTKCDYNERLRDELLRDRFVAGCSSEKIRENVGA